MIQAKESPFQINKNFFNQIYKVSMRFINPDYERQYLCYKYEKKNLLVAIGMLVIFCSLIITIRNIQFSINNYFELTPGKISPFITIPVALELVIGLILEILIFALSKIQIFRGFFLTAGNIIAIVAYSLFNVISVYSINYPLFIPISVMIIPINFVISLLYSYNWICGAIQIIIQISLLEFDICFVEWPWALDKAMLIGLGVCVASCLIIVNYYIEIIQRELFYLKLVSDEEKNNLKSIIDKLPESIVVSNENKVIYVNQTFSDLNLDNQDSSENNAQQYRQEIIKDNNEINLECMLPENTIKGCSNKYVKTEEEKKLSQLISTEKKISLYEMISTGLEIKEEEFSIYSTTGISQYFNVSSLALKFNDLKLQLFLIENLTDVYKIKSLKERETCQRIYFATIAHDFRSPINVIIGYSEILLELFEDPLLKKYALNIFNASNFISFLVQDVLDYSLHKSGKLELALSEFSLENQLNLIIDIYFDKFNDKGLLLKLNYDYNIPKMIFNDANRIMQVMTNLLGNALKFTKKGGVTIEVSQLEEQSNLILIKVIDTGVGMTKEDKKKLFKEFGKLDTHKELNPMGIGLGLYICKQIVEKLGGTIKVKSKLNVGTTFLFTFLCNNLGKEENNNHLGNSSRNHQNNLSYYSLDSQDHLICQPEISPDKLSLSDVKLSSCVNCSKILIVDDDFGMRSILSVYAKRTKILADETDNGNKAIGKVVNKMKSSCCLWYLAIFIDYHMPEMNGDDASLIIKENLSQIENCRTKIILVSGLSIEEKEKIQSLTKNPFFRIETKPLTYRRFKEIIQLIFK